MTETVVVRPVAYFGAVIDSADGDEGNVFVLDCTVSEEHRRSAQVTDHAIELGGVVSDHVRIMPAELVLTGIQTVTPLLEADWAPDRDRDAWRELVRLMEAREPLRVSTSLEVYNDMMIVELSTPRASGVGQAIVPTIRFRHVSIVSPQTTTLPPPVMMDEEVADDASEEVDRGEEAAAPAEEATEQRSGSVLAGLDDRSGGRITDAFGIFAR